MKKARTRAHLMHAYLPDHPGEGVQHIALATDDILRTAGAPGRQRPHFRRRAPGALLRHCRRARLPGHGAWTWQPCADTASWSTGRRRRR
ncbi:hypothetical protein ACRAWF_08905 [Streptomyces sp. L7]